MGQLLALAVPLTDPVHHSRQNDDDDDVHHDDHGEVMDSRSFRRHSSTHSIGPGQSSPREFSESVMGHSFLNDSLSSSMTLPSMARARLVKKILDSFDTFEFLVDTAVTGVLSHKLGYPGDAQQQYSDLKKRNATDPRKYPPSMLVEYEEEYHRGMITNAFYTCNEIIRMAQGEIMPALVDLASMDKREVRMWLQEHTGGAFVDMRDLEATNKRPKKFTTTYISSTTLISNHRRTASQQASGSNFSPQGHVSGSMGDLSAFDGADDVASPRSAPVTEDPAIVALFRGLTGRGIDVARTKCECALTDSWMMLKDPGCSERLNSGNGFFKFMSRSLSECSKEDLDGIRPFVNLSNFADEVIENNVPHVDVYDPEQQALYIALVVKALYILPGVRYTDLTEVMMTDLDYQKNCQPGDCKFFECDALNTFRQNKTIIKFIYTVLIQMRAGMISDPEELKQFVNVEGVVPSRAIVLERTKRNIQKSDSTAKCKSVLLYYQLDGGVLLSHTTVVLNTNVPTVVAKVVNNFGGQGAKEAAETANLTRKYLLKRFGDSRSESA